MKRPAEKKRADRPDNAIQSEAPTAQRLSYRIAELPAVTGISQSTVKRLIAAGKLEKVKVGGMTLITAESVRALLSVPNRKDD